MNECKENIFSFALKKYDQLPGSKSKKYLSFIMEEMSQNFITVEEPVAGVKYQNSSYCHCTRKEKSYRNFGLILISNYNADADALELLALLGLLA